MIVGAVISETVRDAVHNAVRDLVHAERVNGAFYINLPMLYPDGSFVTVRIDEMGTRVRVSDAGFAFREVDNVGGARSFTRIANRVAEESDVSVGDKIIFVDGTKNDLDRAIIDVAEASWRVAHRICQPIFDDNEEELNDALKERLVRLFGAERVGMDGEQTVIGASTSVWTVSAIVSLSDHKAVFQVVSGHANSVYRASTAFRDLSDLPDPPRLISFVKSKKELGTRLPLLTPSRVVEESQPDELIVRAAA